MKLMKLKRSEDEETVAVCENDSCAIDALQIVLGTVAGKGNLIIQDYGKNAFTVLSRATNQALENLTPRQCYENYINNQPIFHLKNAC
jgi:formylmethanofuran dehydrogenase subunit E